MVQGVIYVAYGEKARTEARLSAESLRRHNPALPVAVITDTPIANVACILTKGDMGWKARSVKVGLYDLSSFEHTLYLDADTRVHSDVSGIFDILADGWDMVIAFSAFQGKELMWHTSPQDRALTLKTCPEPLALQAGVLAFRKSDTVKALFTAWREEWERFGRMDQAALLRALQRVPARVWLLGRPWNAMPGGREVVEHLFGRAA